MYPSSKMNMARRSVRVARLTGSALRSGILRLLVACYLIVVMGLLQPSAAQDSATPTNSSKDGSVQSAPPSPTAQANSIGTAKQRPVSWLWLVPNVVYDQKPIWLFPASVVRGHHLKPALIVTGITAGLIIGVDPPSGRHFQQTHSFDGFNRVFSSSNTALATWVTPASFYGIGLARHDSYMQRTFLMAGEAVADSEIVTIVMKDIDRRWKPIEVPMNGNFNDTWFRAQGSYIGGIGSFPSGHAVAAFAVATVFADRYPRCRWIAYGLAGLVGFSRVTEQAHHPSDVFAAAALAYSIAHYVVIRAHAAN